jgi:hypothetical protein
MTDQEAIMARAGAWIATIVPSPLGGCMIQCKDDAEAFIVRDALADAGFTTERYAGRLNPPMDRRKTTIYVKRRV